MRKINGYVVEGNETYTYKHRKMAEQKLGRALKSGEVVHHVDGNRENNDLLNLLIFTSISDHTKFHVNDLNMAVLETLPDGTVRVFGSVESKQKRSYICSTCGKTFTREFRAKSENVYCSNACRIKASRIISATNEELRELTKTKSISEIARNFGVSFAAIKKKLV